MKKTLKNECGYSLIELMGVILILGIVVAIAAPTLVRANRNYRLQSTARDLAQALHTVQNHAISKNSSRKAIFNTTQNKVALSTGAEIVLPDGISFTSLPGSLNAPNAAIEAAAHAGTLPSQAGNSRQAVSFPQGTSIDLREATFNSKGLPQVTPGVVNWIYLTNRQGDYAAITMTSAGETKVLMYNQGQWK